MKCGLILLLLSKIHFRNMLSASPANLKYVMEWNLFLSQMTTHPSANATGKGQEKSSKSVWIHTPTYAGYILNGSIQENLSREDHSL